MEEHFAGKAFTIVMNYSFCNHVAYCFRACAVLQCLEHA